MSISDDLISQFVKATNDETNTNKTTDVYGTVKKVSGSYYVKLDGSDMLTPISTVSELEEDERVVVSINNHTATVTGNFTSPALTSTGETITGIKDGTIQTDGLIAKSAEIGSLKANYAEINNLDVNNLEADHGFFNDLFAKTAFIESLDGNTMHANFADFDEASAKSLLAAAAIIQNATIDGATVTELVGVTIRGDLIQAGTLVADKLVIRTSNGLLYKLNAEALGQAGLADIEDLSTLQNGLHGAIINDKTLVAEKISVSDLVAFDATIAGFNIKRNSFNYTYVRFSYNSDGSDMVTMPYIDSTKTLYIGICDTTNSTAPTDPSEYNWVTYADNVDGDGYNTKRVEGVECQNGYLHFAFSISSDGSDHFYRIYKRWPPSLNDRRYLGMYIDDEYHDSASYTDYTWTYITDSTEIKAECPDGLPGRLYSGAKGSVNSNSIPGIYLDDTGQMNLGNSSSYIKFYNDNGTYKLDIYADDVHFGSSRKTISEAISDISESALSGVDVEYYSSTSPTSLTDGSWQTTAPTWTAGRYIWSRTKVTDAEDNVSYTDAVCITGNTGESGSPGISVTAVVEEYYLSTSEVELTGGSWELEQPEWSEGHYIWTRSAITWSTDVTTKTEPVLAQALTDANKAASDAKSEANAAKSTADDAKTAADNAYYDVSHLNDAISNLVVGKNGTSLMRQTADGWSFNFGDFESAIDDLSKKTEYVNIGNDNGDPLIELGDTDNEMKLQLTNKAANFKIGSAIPTKVTNEGIETDDVTVNDEFRQGNFVWRQRANGNYGLSKWKG